MKLVAALSVVLGYVSLARATTSQLDEYATGVEPRPARQLYEASCELDIELRGAVATVEQRQRIVNRGTHAMAAVHTLALPDGAVVTSFAVRGHDPALLVPATFSTVEADAPDVLGVDPAVLRRLPGGGHEIVVQPIARDREVQLVTRYTTVATMRGGALRLSLPGRDAGRLAACKGVLRVTPGPGVSVQRIRVAGAEVGTRSAAAFVLEARPLALDVELAIAGKQPVVWTQTQALGDGWSASLVTVLAPRLEAVTISRAVLVVDSSTSMELVGKHHVARLAKAIASALPAGTELDAILYDRTATRVFAKPRPATRDAIAELDAAIARRAPANGSNLAGALQLARESLRGARGHALVVALTDGVTAEQPEGALVAALGTKPAAVDLHAIVLDPASTTSPGASRLRAAVRHHGGAYVELGADALDAALATGAITEWLRPALLDLALGAHPIPTEVRAGAGFTYVVFHHGAPKLALTGQADRAFRVAARPAPSAPIGALALARDEAAAFLARTDVPSARQMIERARLAHGGASLDHALAVLAATGRTAKHRRAVVAGGGKYERSAALADPPRDGLGAPASTSTAPASAIARITLERLFRDQLQPKAYACYQRALGLDPKLAGTVQFTLVLGRGEVTDVKLAGLSNPAFDACLLDAAYLLTPPKPDFAINADDQTIATYALAFQRRAEQPFIISGDADSSSPLDIDAIQGGVPPARKPVRVDAATPLGGIKPPPGP